MIKLNLLPPQERKNIYLEKIQRWIIFYTAAIFSILLVFTGLLAGILSFILIEQKTLSGNLSTLQTNSWGQTLLEQRNAISQTNQILEQINRLQKNQKYYSSLLLKIADLVPPEIKVESLSINKDGEAILYGFAPQRSQVLTLDQNLKNSGLFDDIQNPLSNLTKQENINFYLKFKIKPVAFNL